MFFQCALRPRGGQAAEIGLDQRLQRGELEVADESEAEAAEVGEPVAIDRERAIEVDLVEHLDRGRPPAQVIARGHREHLLGECDVGQRGPVPDAARQRILAQKDLAQLERWHEKAVVATSLREVLDEPS